MTSPLIVGHRGLPREYPDNCLAGILAARDLCQMVEIDVRPAGDRTAVVSHDPEFAGRSLDGCDWSILSSLRTGGQPLARLDELLQSVGDFPLNLEFKQHVGELEFHPDVPFALEAAALARPIDILTSFHWPTMEAIRKSFPQLRTGLLVCHLQSIPDALSEATLQGHAFLSLEDSLLGPDPQPLLSEIHSSGFQTLIWTVNSPARAQKLSRLGVHALITDDPKLLARTLKPR